MERSAVFVKAGGEGNEIVREAPAKDTSMSFSDRFAANTNGSNVCS